MDIRKTWGFCTSLIVRRSIAELLFPLTNLNVLTESKIGTAVPCIRAVSKAFVMVCDVTKGLTAHQPALAHCSESHSTPPLLSEIVQVHQKRLLYL